MTSSQDQLTVVMISSSIRSKLIELNIADLPHEDILIQKIFTLLSINDLFNLKLVSSLFNQLINHYLKNLKELNLSKSRWLKSGQFKFMLKINHCFIKKIDLSYNLSLNNHFLCRCLITYRLEQLNCIKFNECHWIDFRFITVLILLYGAQLRCIEIAGVWSLKDEDINLLGHYCLNLKKLNLSKIYSLTDQSLVYLGYHLGKKLKSLNITYCWKMTYMGIYWLSKSCTQLTDLQIDQVHRLSINNFLNNS